MRVLRKKEPVSKKKKRRSRAEDPCSSYTKQIAAQYYPVAVSFTQSRYSFEPAAIGSAMISGTV